MLNSSIQHITLSIGEKRELVFLNESDMDWHIVQEVQIPDEVVNILAFPYKSCFIPKGNGKILLSFRDKLSRNRMIIINNNKFISND